MNRGLLVPAVAIADGLPAPVFHVYRVYSLALNTVHALLVFAFRTPFTCLLDAAEFV